MYFGFIRVICIFNYLDIVKIFFKGVGKGFYLNMGIGFGIIINIVRVIFYIVF